MRRAGGQIPFGANDSRTAAAWPGRRPTCSALDVVRAKDASACGAAEAELRAVDALLSAGCDGPPVCSALVRACHAVGNLDAALHAGAEGLAGDPNSSGIGALHVDFSRIETAARLPYPEPDRWPSRRVLYRARHELARRLELLRREALHKHARRRSRGALVALAVVALGLAVGAALAMRPPVWRVEYFRTPRLVDPVASDLTLDVGGDWGEGPPHDGVPSNDFSSRWETCMVLERPVDIDFRLESDDGSRLLIDDKVIIDQWKEQSASTATARAHLTAGTHALRVEHFELGGIAELSLRARFDGHGGFGPLPRTLLHAPGPAPASGCPR